jgi:hypothetical protein
MQEDRSLVVARISAEASAAARLDDVCRWLIASQGKPVRLGVNDIPALGQVSWLRFGRPIIAPRAVLCALALIEDIDAGGSLLVGQLRFVAHPIASEIRMSFSRGTALVLRYGLLKGQADHAARQLLGVIAGSIAGGSIARAAMAS